MKSIERDAEVMRGNEILRNECIRAISGLHSRLIERLGSQVEVSRPLCVSCGRMLGLRTESVNSIFKPREADLNRLEREARAVLSYREFPVRDMVKLVLWLGHYEGYGHVGGSDYPLFCRMLCALRFAQAAYGKSPLTRRCRTMKIGIKARRNQS